MNDKETVQVKKEFIELAAAQQTAQVATETPVQKDLIDEFLDSIEVTFDQIKKSEGVQTFEFVYTDFLKKLKGLKKGKALEKIVFDIFMVLGDAFVPIMIANYVARQRLEKGYFRDVRNKIRAETLDNNSLAELYRRDKSRSPKLYKELAEKGYTDEDIENILELSTSLMGANDVISLLGRNAFDDKFANTAGLDEGFSSIPAHVKSKLDRTGFPMGDLPYYWRAHYVTPSINTIDLMRHLNLITPAEQTEYLKAANYPPRLIPKIIEAGHTQLNKIDVRRLYNTSVINTHRELVDAYKRMGYDDSNADKLATLAEVLKPREKMLRTHEHEKTKDDVINAYGMQLYSKGEVTQILKDLGYGKEDIELFIVQEDYKTERERANILLNAYHRAYVNGVYDTNKIIIELGHLNLPSKYVDVLIEAWELERVHKVERPSKSEILSFFKSGIIDRTTCVNELRSLGYNDKYIEWFIAAATKEKSITHGVKSATS